MYLRILITAATLSLTAFSHANVIVNAVAGEDVDGNSPFETLQAGLNAAIATSDSVIEIQTNGLIPGAWVGPATTILTDITIRAGVGNTPTLTSNLMFNPANGTTCTITLKNLTIRPTIRQNDFPTPGGGDSGRYTPLVVGCNLIAEDCKFGDNFNGPVSGAYPYGVSAATGSSDTNASITLTRCHLRGHNGMAAGRSVRDYTLTDCLIEGVATSFDNWYSAGILNLFNYEHDFVSRLSSPAYQEVTQPRSLTLNRCIVRAPKPLCWPGDTLPNSYYQNENSTIGPVTATNTVFVGVDETPPSGLDPYQYAYSAFSSRLGSSQLPPNQNPSATFTHCTFTSNNQSWEGDPAIAGDGDPFVEPNRLQGAIRIQGINQVAVTDRFVNCLFDVPRADYAIGVDQPSHTTATVVLGDANAYRTLTGREYVDLSDAPGSGNFEGNGLATTLAAFEATIRYPAASTFADARLTDNSGTVITPVSQGLITNKAVATVPVVAVDKDNQSRPQPVSAAKSDIGADEVDEGLNPSSVADWTIFE